MRRFPFHIFLALLVGCQAPLEESQPKQILEFNLDEGTNMAATLSPDGKTLAFDLLGRIWLMPVEGGRGTAITDSLGNARQPQWSPDGSQLTFQAYWDGNWHVYTINRDGTNLRQMTTGDFDYREPHWSPDGTSLIFSSDRAGTYDIWSLDIVGERLTGVTSDPGNEFGPRWSPEGDMLAYVQSTREGSWIVKKPIESEGERVYQGNGTLAGVSWSADGSALVFNELRQARSELVRIDAAGGEAQILTTEEEVFPFPVSWTTDGSMVFTASGKIVKRYANGEIEDVPFEVPVVLDRSSYTRKKRDLSSIGPFPVKGIAWPQLSPTGDKIAFVALQDLWLRSEDGSLTQLTDDRYVQILPAWSPDGRSIAFCSDQDGSFGIWTVDVASGDLSKLLDTGGAVAGISWSPDGGSIAYTQSFRPSDGQLRILNVASGESRQVGSSQAHSVGMPSWSPDSKMIALTTLDTYSSRFREGVNRIKIFDISQNTERYQEAEEHWSFGGRGTDGPVWSPDGSQMLVHGRGALWLMPVDENGDATGEPRRLTEELSEAPSWGRNGTSVLYMATDELKIMNMEDRTSSNVPIEMTWERRHPDTRVVVHAGALIDGTADQISRDVDIVVQGSRIIEVKPHEGDHDGEDVIDASDAFVIPGLMDVHVHEGSSFGSSLGKEWLAWGVTAVRNPSSNPYDALNRREAVQSGKVTGPRMFYTGFAIDGSRIYYGGGRALQSEQQIDWELDRADRLDYDLIKTYVRLADPLQKRVVEGAHRIGIPVTSHEVFPAVGYGADGTEHISGTSRIGYSSKITRTWKSYNDVTDLLAKSGMSFTPTTAIIAFRYMIGRDSSVLEDERIGFFGRRLGGIPGFIEPEWEDREQLYQNLIQMVKDVHDKGGFVVAGTDSPIIPYGFGLHMEMESYQDAGLTPFEVLQTATINNARLLNAEDDLGTVEVGKFADFVIVEANPLEDIRNVRKVRTVIKNGQVYHLEDLLNPESDAEDGTASLY